MAAGAPAGLQVSYALNNEYPPWVSAYELSQRYQFGFNLDLPFTWTDRQSFYFTQSAFVQGLHSSVYPNAPAGVLYSGDPGVPSDGKTNPNQWWHFSPRLGVAIDPTGAGRR